MSAVFVIGLALGLRHAFDPRPSGGRDQHVERRPAGTRRVGCRSVVGYAATPIGVGSAILATGWSFPRAWQNGVDAMVGFTFRALGMF